MRRRAGRGSRSAARRDLAEREIVGFFAATRKEWLDRLEALRDPVLRRRMGERARETVLQRYSMEEQARLLIRILRGLVRDDVDALRARTC